MSGRGLLKMNMPGDWGNIANAEAAPKRGRSRSRRGSRSRRASRSRGSRSRGSRSRSASARLTNSQRNARVRARNAAGYTKALTKMGEIYLNPEEDDVIYDPEDPENPEKHYMYYKGEWVLALDVHGDHGGPYPASEAGMRQLKANPVYRALEAAAAADAAAAAGVDFAQSIVDAEAKKEKVTDAAAIAEGLKRVREEIAKGEADPIKLGAKARRGFKAVGKAAAGGGRSRKAVRKTRKGRKGTRRH